MTAREMMTLHANIMSLQEMLSISYKNASHQLYMSEWEKLTVDDKTDKAFSGLTKRLQASLTGFQKRLEALSAPQSGRCLGTDDNASDDADADADADANADDAVDSNAE